VTPDEICSAPGAAPTPPSPTEPSGGASNGGGGESSGPIDDLDVPPVIVVPDVPLTPPSNPDEAANPSTPTTPTGSQKAEHTAQTVVAKMHTKKLSACALALTATSGDQQKLVARGFAIAPRGGTGQMIITVRLVPTGKVLLEAHFGGVLTHARAKCITTANSKPSGTVTAFKTTLVVLQVEHAVTAPGSFLPDKPVFTPTGMQYLTQLRALITDPLLMGCDGYTAVYPPSPVNAHTLSTERAQAACRMLNQKHLLRPPKIVAHGHTDPVATNSTEAGRSHNRRVEVTVVHRIKLKVTVQPQV
jgi:hypothetical protein